MELFNMEEFLGSSWAPEQTFDCFHFDDMKGIEADDGLMELSVKFETLADTPMEMLQDLSPTSQEGSLDMEWMEQSNLMLDVPLVDVSVTDTALQLGDDFIPSSIEVVKPESDTHESVSVDEFLQNLLKLPEDPTPMVETESALSPAPSPEARVVSEIRLAAEDSGLEPGLNCQFLRSPLSSDEVESVLSSACSPASLPASPPSSISTVDAACLFSEDSQSLCSTDLYKVIENTEKARSAPYSKPQKQNVAKSSKLKGRKQTASISPNPSELELEMMSKKDRKKLQNKNAAIRYRMKKKVESDQKRSEVDELESVNDKLRDKFEELMREVQYMKDLIDDVRKAQDLPPIIHKQIL